MANMTIVASILFMVGVATFPLYILPSGLPQLSHIIMLLFWAAYSLNCKTLKFDNRINGIFLVYVAYVVVRQLVFVLQMDDAIWLEPVLFLLFNFVVYLSVYRFFVNDTELALRMLRYGLTVSIIVAMAGVYIGGVTFVKAEDTAYRVIGTFNNPNQLGYFALCVSGLLSVLYVHKKISWLMLLVLYAGCVMLVILSLSKAALLSIFVFGLVFVRKMSVKLAAAMAAVLVLGVFSTIANDYSTDMSDLKVYQRLESIGADSDDSLEGRGMALLRYPDERIIFGYGEGFVKTTKFHKEVHSTFGNVIISYGLLGFMVFMFMLYGVFKGVFVKYGVFVATGQMLPILLYGVAHNGLRFSIFWIYFAVLVAVSNGHHALSGKAKSYSA